MEFNKKKKAILNSKRVLALFEIKKHWNWKESITRVL